MATIDLGKIKQVFRGTYDNSTAYVPDDLVVFTDTGITSTYICTTASTGNNPSSGGTAHANWAYVAKGVADPIPTQTGNSGKFLKTNGSALSFDNAGAVLQIKEYVCRDFETQSFSANSQMATQLEGHITPTSSSNKIRITVCAFFMGPNQYNSSFQIKKSTNGGSSYGGLDATVQSAENVSRATGHIPSLWGRGHNWSDNVNSIATVIDSPNTTSQTYYRLFWMSSDNGTLQTNYNYDTSQTGNAFCKTVSILRLEEIDSSAVTLTNIT